MFNIKWWGTKVIRDKYDYEATLIPIEFDNKDIFYKWLDEKFKQGDRLEIIVRKESQNISHDMYEFLYGAIYEPLGQQEGMLPSELDEIFKDAYAQTHGIYLPKGFSISKSVDFDKAEMLKFIEFVQDMVSQWYGFIVTPINEMWKK